MGCCSLKNQTDATPLLSFPTAQTSANMQTDDYWACASNYPKPEAIPALRYVNVVLPCRRHGVPLSVYQLDTDRPVEQPQTRLRKS